MSKCSKCGCQCEDGAKFCDECGAPIPQEKECPKCHAHIGLSAKFCDECGFSFENVGTKQPTIVMGDKNVIAGDVVAHKESYDIKGNATIVKNEDESKKMVQCSDCGKNIPVSHSFECPSCHRIVCEECFDKDARKCKKCCGAKSSAGEDAYRTAILEALADGKIDVADRKRLMGLQKQLGLSAARAIQIEKKVKSASATTGESKNTATLDKVNAEKAYELLYVKGDYKKAAELLAPIRERNPNDESILALYLAALAKFNPVKARKVVEDLHADVLVGALTLIDIDLKRKDLATVEKRLTAAFAVWPDSVLLKCRKAIYAYEMFKATEDSAPLMEATETLESIVDCKDAIEKSWKFFAKGLIDSALGDTPEQITAESCSARGLLWDIISQNEDKSNSLYHIIDLSEGPSAKYYPSYYMNTESIFDWPDEFKTDLIVFRLVSPGSFIMGSKLGEKQNNPSHLVTITHSFYMAVFELTQRQWEQVTGERPSCFCNNQFYAKRPVERISYKMLRGKRAGLKWPVGKNIDSDSFIGILRKKSNVANIDLPTESQWEYACRAGCVSDYYDGINIADDSGDIVEHLNKIARFNLKDVNTDDNGCSEVDLTSGTGEVGVLVPNAWGLYDMLGNVEELCLDENVNLEPYRKVDPEYGLTTDPEDACRVVRGGCWNSRDFESVSAWGRGACYRFSSGWTTGGRLAIQCYSDADVKEWSERCNAELSAIPDLVCKKAYEFQRIDMTAKYLYARCLMNGCGGLIADTDAAQTIFEELSGEKYPPAQHIVASFLLEKAEKLGSLELRKKAKELFQDAVDAGNLASLTVIKKLTKLSPECANAVGKIFEKYAVNRKKTDEFNIPDLNDRQQIERYEEFIDAVKEGFGYSDEMISRNVLALLEHEDSDVSRGTMFTDDGIYTLNGADNELLWKPSVVLQWDEFVDRGCVEEDSLGYVKIFNEPETYVSVWNQFVGDIDDAIKMFKEIQECVRSWNHLDKAAFDKWINFSFDQLPQITESQFRELDALSCTDNPQIELRKAICLENGYGRKSPDKKAAIVSYRAAWRAGSEDAAKALVALAAKGKKGFARSVESICRKIRKEIDSEGGLVVDREAVSSLASKLVKKFIEAVRYGDSLKPKTIIAVIPAWNEKEGILLAVEGIYVIKDCRRGVSAAYLTWEELLSNAVVSKDPNSKYDFILVDKPERVIVNMAGLHIEHSELHKLFSDIIDCAKGSDGRALLQVDEDSESDEESVYDASGESDEEPTDDEDGASDEKPTIARQVKTHRKYRIEIHSPLIEIGRQKFSSKKELDRCDREKYDAAGELETYDMSSQLDCGELKVYCEDAEDPVFSTKLDPGVDNSVIAYKDDGELFGGELDFGHGEVYLYVEEDFECKRVSEIELDDEFDPSKLKIVYRTFTHSMDGELCLVWSVEYNGKKLERRFEVEESGGISSWMENEEGCGEFDIWEKPDQNSDEEDDDSGSEEEDDDDEEDDSESEDEDDKDDEEEESEDDEDESEEDEIPDFSDNGMANEIATRVSDCVSDRKRIVFLLLGVFLGFVGLHFKYARRKVLFHLTWLSLVSLIACAGLKHKAIGGIFLLIWLALWLGGTIFVKKDSGKKTMKWF